VKNPPDAWCSLAEGETAAHALGSDPTAAAPGLSLYRGHAGLALFFAYLEQSLGDSTAGELAQHHLDRAIAGLLEQPPPDASLYHGFAGVAWVAEHLSSAETSAEGADPNAEIDAALLSILRHAPWKGEFDLLGGLVGWGVYALDRLPRPSAVAMLPLVVARLGEAAEQGAHGISWRSPRNATREPDSGMAHGSAAAIAFLVRMLSRAPAASLP
jgi:lantibiotic biosynthesis protein